MFTIKALENIQGGAERVLADISRGLANRGFEVSVVSFDKPAAAPFYELDKNIRHIKLGIGNAALPASFFESISRMKALRSLVEQEKPDIVVPFMHSSFIPAAFALLGKNVPLVASEHIVPHHYKNRGFEFLLLMISSFFVQKITVLSEDVKRLYPRFLHSKMVVIPNPVHPPAPVAVTHKDPSKIILNVGRLDDQKDQKTLIESFALLAARYPEWVLHIYGEGPLKDTLSGLINQHNLQNRVVLKGTTRDIGPVYAAADIFAMSSKYESFGLATAEAMSYGKAAIGFLECPGTNELIIDGENGLLVSKADGEATQAFADGLERLMEDEALRNTMGEKARTSMAKFSPDKIVDLWERLLEDEIKAQRR